MHRSPSSSSFRSPPKGLESPKTSIAMERGFGTDPIRPVLLGGSRSDAERERSSSIHGETKGANRTPSSGLGSSKQAGGYGQLSTEEANLESSTRKSDFVSRTGIEGDKPLPGEAGDVESDVPIEGPMPLEKHVGDMSDSCGAEKSPSASEPFKEISKQTTESLEHDSTPEVHDVITERDEDRLRYLYVLGTVTVSKQLPQVSGSVCKI